MPAEDSDLNFLQGLLSTVLDESAEGLIVLDGGGRCRMIGRRASEMFGIDTATYLGKPGVEVLEAFADACEEPDAFWRAAAAPLAAPGTDAEVEVRRPLARTVLCRAVAMGRSSDSVPPTPRASHSGEGDGRVTGRVILLREITVERAAESSTRQLRARLRALMPFDGLTGLLNQRRLYEELGREHSRSTRAWDSYALLRVDIDGMKALNEEAGTPSGDQIIEQVARRLETCVREYDVLARLEGDEFGVLLPGADSVAARAVGERMARAVAEERFPLATAPSAGDDEDTPIQNDGTLRFAEPLLPPERSVTVSVGGALWVPPSRQSAEAIFRRAGDALRDARRQGGGVLCLYEET